MFHKQKSFERENTIEYSLVIAIMSILFIIVISMLSFLIYQQYSAPGQEHAQLGDYDLRQRSDEFFIDPVVIQNIQSFSEHKY
jgi:hypothetical protein